MQTPVPPLPSSPSAPAIPAAAPRPLPLLAAAALGVAAATMAAGPARAAAPALTVYNADFAVVRETLPLVLRPGLTDASFPGVTALLEPDSVILRDPSGRVPFRVLDQSYRAETISRDLLLQVHEGQWLDFRVPGPEGSHRIEPGRIVRGPGGGGQPIIEMEGKLRFGLPGEPLFPALTDDAILHPTLSWRLVADQEATLDAELSYITGGLRWQAAYNLVSPEAGDTVDVVGWVTIQNGSGMSFPDAVVKLMAGDVRKIQPPMQTVGRALRHAAVMEMDAAAVTEKAFDDFHLYSLPRPVTLRNGETKQVEFLRGQGVRAPRFYVYDGAAVEQYRGWSPEMIRNDRDYGTQTNKKVWVIRELENSEANGLGLPLPAGRVRFYRSDEADGRLEFTGEDQIDHTARGETLRLRVGDAFDLVGERVRTDYRLNNDQDWMEEEFEIRLRNRKERGDVEIRVVEHLYRWVNWSLVHTTHPFTKKDARTVEARVTVPAGGEVVVRYRVRYDWQ